MRVIIYQQQASRVQRGLGVHGEKERDAYTLAQRGFNIKGFLSCYNWASFLFYLGFLGFFYLLRAPSPPHIFPSFTR